MPVEITRDPGCLPGTWWWTEGEAGPTVSCPKCQALGFVVLLTEWTRRKPRGFSPGG